MALVDEIILEHSHVRTHGRAAVNTHAVRVRDLNPADIAMLGVEGRPSAEPRPLVRIKDSHHALARALAGGMKDVEAAIVTGYDPSRISILKGDPSFKALVDFYRDNLNAVFADLHNRMAGLSFEAASRLRDLLEDDENKVSATVLLDILKATADRTGYAPVVKSEVKTLHLTPEDLRKLNDETNETNRVRIGAPPSPNLRPGNGEPSGLLPVAQTSPQGVKGEGEDI